jgi:hypothetical protein
VGEPGAESVNSTVVFQAPHFTFWTTVYTALGAMFFWTRTGRAKLKVYALSWLFDILKVPDSGKRQVVEFIIFIVFGCLIGIGIANPATVAQAVTAGFAWTGFVAKRA